MTYKQPVSVLVVIYAKDTGRVLMLQRRDDLISGSRSPATLEEVKPRRKPLCAK